LFSFKRLERLLIGEIGDITFADLKLPYAAVATDLHTGEMVVINHGRVAPAVRASCSVPGIVEPALIDGRLLVDGNYSNSTPVSVVREMGAEYVIGVDIFTPTLRDYLGPIGYAIAGFEILVQAAGGGITTADCLISPDLKGKTYVRFSKREQLLELGKEAAREKLPAILEALNLAGNVSSPAISN
jgi:NTE family protein